MVYDQNTAATNPLSGGTTLNGDGTVLQLGYYSSATALNNFQGTWIPLSGETSLNTALIPGGGGETYNQTSIGDLTASGAGNATFAVSLDFIAGDLTSGNNLPNSPTIPLALRFYNSTTIASSTYFNVVSNDLWLWKPPQPSNVPNTVAITLDQTGGLEWESIVVYGQAANTAFHTTIAAVAVPETSTVLIGLLSTSLVMWSAFRRYRKLSS